MSDQLVVNKYLSDHVFKSACKLSDRYIRVIPVSIMKMNKQTLHIKIKSKEFAVSKVKLSLFVGGGLRRN